MRDVAADGDCFYRCVLCCLRGDAPVWAGLGLPDTPRVAILALRRLVAWHIREDDEVIGWVTSLIMLQLGEPTALREDNPLLRGAKSLSGAAANVETGGAWASQIEVGVVRKLTAAHGIEVVVLEGGGASAADQMLAALDKTRAARCLVLVRVDDCHYCFLRLGLRRLFSTAWLTYRAACEAMLEDFDDQLF